MSHRVFICYRREDTREEADQLQLHLDQVFGAGTAFRDERSIDQGGHWPEELRDALESADVVLILIGPNWLKSADKYHRRRLDLPDDWVRTEIEQALASEGAKLALPILLRDTHGPETEATPAEGLPPTIAALAEIQMKCYDRSRIVDIVAGIRAQIEAQLAAGEEAPADPLPAYRSFLRTRHRNLITCWRNTRPMELPQVFVDVQMDRLADDDVHERLKTRGAPRPGAVTLTQLLEDETAAGQAGRWVLLGEPGAGKSTLVRRATYECAERPDRPIPVFVPLARWATALGRHPFDLAAEHAFDVDGEAIRAALRHLAGEDGETGRVWVFLDGLDEVAPEHVHALRAQLQLLAAGLPRAHIVVTTRAVGFQDIGPGWRHARLRPLEKKAQDELLHNLCDADLARRIRERLDRSPSLATLAGNPLLLTLLAELADPAPGEEAGGDGTLARLPDSRTGVFAAAIGHLLAKDFNHDNRHIEHPDEARKVLRGLCLVLQRSGRMTWPREELDGALRAAKSKDPEVADALGGHWKGDEDFLTQVAQRTGILAAHDGPGAEWKFLHRQFRETLAAEAMHQATDPSLDYLRPSVPWTELVGEELDADSIQRWSETLGMYCALTAEPMSVLQTLREKSPAATVRALGDVDGLPPRQLLEFLLEIPTEPLEREPDWNGADLRAAVRKWKEHGVVAPAEATGLLLEHVRAFQGPADVAFDAWIHYALRELVDVDDPEFAQRFFSACGRPRPDPGGFRFARIPGGSFVMGSPRSEAERFEDEGPEREVKVAAFGLAPMAVTNEAYGEFDPHHEPRRWEGVSESELGKLPVVEVDWWSASLYCAYVGGRLPTEAEWEYACRAGETTPFSFGATIRTDQVNYDGNRPYGDAEPGEYRERPVAVGSLPANRFGLHEMHGNVWEWCEDRWHDSYDGAPPTGAAWIEGESEYRVVRGGSWGSFARDCRSASRLRFAPGYRDDNLGFRPARSCD